MKCQGNGTNLTEARARILVVDDDPDIRELLRRLLSTRHDVVAAENGREAIVAIGKLRPDLVVTDVTMPDIDGIALVKHLRAADETAGLPILMLTALNTSQDKTSGFDVGADDYLGKPFDLAELMARVKSLLRRAHLGSGTTSLSLGRIPDDATGFVTGLTLPSVLQMINLDRKSCQVRVNTGNQIGTLSFLEGDLVAAIVGTNEGEPAAYEILTWQETRMELREGVPAATRTISTPLAHLLMEAVRLQDERGEPPVTEPIPNENPGPTDGLVPFQP